MTKKLVMPSSPQQEIIDLIKKSGLRLPVKKILTCLVEKSNGFAQPVAISLMPYRSMPYSGANIHINLLDELVPLLQDDCFSSLNAVLVKKKIGFQFFSVPGMFSGQGKNRIFSKRDSDVLEAVDGSSPLCASHAFTVSLAVRTSSFNVAVQDFFELYV